MSTTALGQLAGVVIGVDRSAEMLAVAVAAPTGTSALVRSAAETLPFASGSFDAITVSSGVHWFDQPRFFLEARRLLRPTGWIALYDHYFIGEMVDVPEFPEWTRRALERFPLPKRNAQVGDPRAETPAGFESMGDEFYEDDIEMTQQQLVEYELSLSNFVAACERGATRDELRAWLSETTAPFYANTSTRTVRFLGSVTCLRVLTEDAA
jgi:ubiquinone/menaquinone biosynthesis C-methylase UbiE